MEPVDNTFRKYRRILLIIIAVGLLVALVCVIKILREPKIPKLKDFVITSEDGVTIPKMEEYIAKPGEEVSYISYIVYDDSLYTEYEVWVSRGKNDNITMPETAEIGVEKLGTGRTRTNKIDVYSVNGYDPSFMLNCGYSYFIKDNDVTYKYGSELFEDQLHLKGRTRAAEYESYDSWYYSKGQIFDYELTEENSDLLERFIDSMNKGLFRSTWQLTPDGRSGYDVQLYSLYLVLDDGMPVHLRLLDGGYVMFAGIPDICVKVEDDVFNELISILDKK